METERIHIQPISPADNAGIARIIRCALEEFGAARPGTVYFDKSTDNLFELFQMPRAAYYVAHEDGVLLGGGGIYPTDGLPVGTCELVKMYLSPEARGKGLGSRLIRQCLGFAAEAGYSQVYLESMPELKNALRAYERLGFRYLDAPMGNSGHFGRGLWMLKTIENERKENERK